MTRDYRTSPKRHGVAVSHAFHARQADPDRTPHHSTAGTTPRTQMKPATPPPRQDQTPLRHATTPHTCGRAPGQPAGRAPFPTNRHEGGSLT